MANPNNSNKYQAQPLTIEYKLHTDIKPPEAITIGDWIDLRAAKTMLIREKEYELIPLGISMKLPEGYEAIVAPRSSTFKNYGLIMTNSIGVIDNSYSGDEDEWHFPAYCLKGEWLHIVGEGLVLGTKVKKGDRICQFRIQRKMPSVSFVKMETLGGENRGGLGSTGVE